MVSGIYQLRNQVNGKCYIGSAVSLTHRKRQHLSDLRSRRHYNQHLQRAFDKHGQTAFVFSVLERVDEVSQLIMREQHYLDTLRPEYNIAPIAGSPLGVRHTEETRRRMSRAQTGRRHTEETKRKLSKMKMGKELSPEHRKACGRGHRGKHLSEEHRRKISESVSAALMGHSVSDYTRQRVSETHKGIPLSEQHRKKISEARTGHTVSEETRRKISLGMRGNQNWRRRKPREVLRA